MIEWTVDTVILNKAVDSDNLNFLHFLLNINEEGNMICHDHEGRIKREYERTINSRNNKTDFIRNWYSQMISKNRIIKYSGQLHSKHRKMLTQFKFHDDDIPFVAVCFFSNNKILVSTESDYSPKINNYLAQTMRLTVIGDINQAKSMSNSVKALD